MTSLGSKKKAGKVDKFFFMAHQFYDIHPRDGFVGNMVLMASFPEIVLMASFLRNGGRSI